MPQSVDGVASGADAPVRAGLFTAGAFVLGFAAGVVSSKAEQHIPFFRESSVGMVVRGVVAGVFIGSPDVHSFLGDSEMLQTFGLGFGAGILFFAIRKEIQQIQQRAQLDEQWFQQLRLQLRLQQLQQQQQGWAAQVLAQAAADQGVANVASSA